MKIDNYTEVLNPNMVFYTLLAAIIIILLPVFKRRLRKSNRIVSNTKYARKSKMYKLLKARLIIIFLLILGSFIGVMYSGGKLLERTVNVKEEVNEKYNRDIFIVMDVSGSVLKLDSELCKTFKKVVDSLDGDRVGIMIFDSSAVTLAPLTDDYEYIKQVLDKVINAVEANNVAEKKYINAGTRKGNGSSLIGDGLASCVNQFVKADMYNQELDGVERTKIILFATDNYLAGSPLFTLDQASKLAKDNNIKVFGLDPNNTLNNNTIQINFKNNVESTGGKYYKLGDANYVESVVKEITSLEKSLLKTEKNIVKTDDPIKPFWYLLISVAIYIVLGKWVLK